MAGFAEGPAAHQSFVTNLRYACNQAAPSGLRILIEPLNPYDAPGYFLGSTGQAAGIISEVDEPNLAIMFDCYHVQLIEGDITNRLERLMHLIGHIQFASVPDRGTPDHGEIDYAFIFKRIAALGWDDPLGAEYKPQSGTDDSLGWLASLGRITSG
jgi:hydroxypyruvate isomerase